MPGIADAKPPIASYDPPLVRLKGRNRLRHRKPEPKVERSPRSGRSMCAIFHNSSSKSLTINFPAAKLDIGIEITRSGIFFTERHGNKLINIKFPEDCLLQVNIQEAKRLRRFGSMGIEIYAVYEEGGGWKAALASQKRLKQIANRRGFLFVAPSGTLQINEIKSVTVNLPGP